MALLVRGKTLCRLFGEVMASEATVEMFPSGLFQRDEPSFEVNDAAVHASCFDSRLSGYEARARRNAYLTDRDETASE